MVQYTNKSQANENQTTVGKNDI